MRVFPYSVGIDEQAEIMQKIGVSAEGMAIMNNRFQMFSFIVHDISSSGANALKQHFLHVGGEVALPREAIAQTEEKISAFCSIPVAAIPLVAKRLHQQWWHLPEIGNFLEQQVMKRSIWHDFAAPHIDTTRPAIMGILNVTPDSFSDGGQFVSVDSAVQAGAEMIQAGADIIDVGGESSRPGAQMVSETDELERVIPVIAELSHLFPQTALSVDTTKARVADEALAAGATIVNNIDGLRDEKLVGVIAKHDATLIIMHMKGNPETMQENPHYDNLFREISTSLEESVSKALAAGIARERLIVDPGIGFGKTADHNLSIIKHLEWLSGMTLPILIGASRKSVIGTVADIQNPAERGAGTMVLHTMALDKGAAILRVHDVSEAVQGLHLFSAVRGATCC